MLEENAGGDFQIELCPPVPGNWLRKHDTGAGNTQNRRCLMDLTTRTLNTSVPKTP